MKINFCIAWMLLLSIFCQAMNQTDSSICFLRDANGSIREHNVDFIKMKLDVKFNTKAGKVFGNVKYDLRPIQPAVDTIFLNAPAITIQSVLFNGIENRFTSDSSGVTIRFVKPLDWNKNYTLEIKYEATPQKGLYFIGWNVDSTKGDKKNRYYTRKQIWTQGQGTDNRFWIPCYDDVNDKMITETTITFDSTYQVISNGVLKSKKTNSNGTSTWHYAMSKPMVPYLIMIGIDKYAFKDYKSKNGMVSRQYYYADHPETLEPTYVQSAEMMDWLCSELGVAYPWETYSNTPVQDFMYGAMENTTATVFGDFLLCDSRSALERPYVSTNAHELTHQWFGDYITEYSATHHWLHESFATYYAKQFIHKVYGEDRYQWDRRNEHLQAIQADKSDRFPVAHSSGGSARHYPKGSAVIDMLRYVVGDSVFKKSVSNYLKKHAYANVLSDDFKMTFMETAGINLSWFFDEWIYRAGFPKYNVSFTQKNELGVFYIEQTHQVDELTGYFKMPVIFEIHFKDGSFQSSKNWLSNHLDSVTLKIPEGKEVDYTLFDPGSTVIKEVQFSKSLAELKAQAEKAKHLVDRYDALVMLRDTAIEKKQELLVRMFNANYFHILLNEIIEQLSNEKTPEVLDIFKRALNSKDFLVRRSVVDDLDNIPESILPEVEKLLNDSSYYTIENTLKKLCRLYPDKKEFYLNQTDHVFGLNNNVRIAWLEIAIKSQEGDSNADKKYANELIEFASDRYEFRTRVRAFEALERSNVCNEDLIAHLFNAALSSNGRLANPALKCLRHFVKKPTYQQMAQAIFSLSARNEKEKQILEPLVR